MLCSVMASMVSRSSRFFLKNEFFAFSFMPLILSGRKSFAEWEDAVILGVNTTHLWQWRQPGDSIEVEKLGSTEKTEQFILRSGDTSARSAVVQFYDTQSELTLTAFVNIDENGALSMGEIRENSDLDITALAVEQMWAQLGYTAPIPEDVVIRSANVLNDDSDDIYDVGEMEVTIDGNDYELYLSVLPRIAELNVPAETVDLMTEEVIPVIATETEIGSETVQVYQRGSRITAIWEHFGCHYVLKSRNAEPVTVEKAVAVILGV